MRALLLPVGDETYAVELTSLHAVVGDPKVYKIPTAPRGVLGAINLRGEIVAVLDTADLLGLGRTELVAFAAVLDHPSGAVALAAEGRPVTVQLGRQVAGAELAGTKGTFAVDDGIATLLDPATLLVSVAA